MRKNVKAIGVAAAALLALAPVVATSSTADADVINKGANNLSRNEFSYLWAPNPVASKEDTANFDIKVGIDIIPGKTTANDVVKNMEVTVNGVPVQGLDRSKVQIEYHAPDGMAVLKPNEKFNAKDVYYFLLPEGIKINNLSPNKEYAVTGIFEGDKVTPTEIFEGKIGMSNPFKINDLSLKGTPEYVDKSNKKKISEATIEVPVAGNKISDEEYRNIVGKAQTEFEKKYSLRNTYEGKDAAKTNKYEIAAAFSENFYYNKEIKSVETNKDGEPEVAYILPASNEIKFNITGSLNNGKKTTLPVTIKFVKSSDSDTTNTSSNSNDNSSVASVGNDTASSVVTMPGNATVTNSNNSNASVTVNNAVTNNSTTDKAVSTGSQKKSTSASKVAKTKKTMTVMSTAYVYNKNHKRVGHTKYVPFKRVVITGNITQLKDGTSAFMIGKNRYIVANNITGKKRTLKRNAFVYATSTKRAKRKMLKKGAKVTTYGSPIKFKNGKRYYRIQGATKTHKMYVKAVNFK